MSDALTVLSPEQALQMGGIGMGGMFRGRPQSLELVSKATRQDNAIPGKFRVLATNEHFETMRVVLLDSPREQREYYLNDGKTYSAEQKMCFSLNNVQPHERSKEPQALYCATCGKGERIDPKTGRSAAWEDWRQHNKDPKYLPQCNMFYHLFLADRVTQTPYYFNVKGTSVKPFKDAMEMQMFGLLQKIMAQTKLVNKQRGYLFVMDPVTKATSFIADPAFLFPMGKTERDPIEPLPNIFDISFELFSSSKGGGPFVVGLRDFKYMHPAERAEFGALYLDFATRRDQGQVGAEAEMRAAAEADFQAAKKATTQAATQPAPVVVIPNPNEVPTVVEGVIVGRDEPITI